MIIENKKPLFPCQTLPPTLFLCFHRCFCSVSIIAPLHSSTFTVSYLSLSLSLTLKEMGRAQNCSDQRRYKHLIIPIFLLLGSKLFHAQGKALSGLVTEPEEADLQRGVVEEHRAEKLRRRLIGSSPPRCERRCSSCGRCEAVQVPIAAQQQRAGGISRLSAFSTPRIAYSRGGGDDSNYKPMTWKCKCGDLLFNP